MISSLNVLPKLVSPPKSIKPPVTIIKTNRKGEYSVKENKNKTVQKTRRKNNQKRSTLKCFLIVPRDQCFSNFACHHKGHRNTTYPAFTYSK